MKIIGYRKNDFKTNEGVEVTGYTVFIATEIDPRRGAGVSVERQYLSDKKLAKEDIDLAELMDREVKVYYNRFGRVDSIVPVD
ncbi:MAG: hypothetical protein ACLUUL_03505 [Gemmiger sp.]